MLKSKVKDVAKYLEVAWKLRRPVFLHGRPGIGKSAAVKQFAASKGIECNDKIRLSQIEPTDLGGLPIVKDGKMERVYPSWLPTEGEGILFLDELNKGMPSTQSAAYQLVLDRQLGEARLGDDWMVVAAGNRSTDRVTIYEMDSALQNRFPLHIEVETPSAEEVLEYFKSIGKTDAQIAGFLLFKPSRVWMFDEKAKDPAWASPRTWEFMHDMLDAVKDMPKAERMAMLRNLAVGCLGDVVGREFREYVALSETVSVREILDNPAKFAEIEKPDVQHSVITEIADLYRREKGSEKKVIDFVFALKGRPEMVMLALTMFGRVNQNFVAKVVADKRGGELAEYMEKFI